MLIGVVLLILELVGLGRVVVATLMVGLIMLLERVVVATLSVLVAVVLVAVGIMSIPLLSMFELVIDLVVLDVEDAIVVVPSLLEAKIKLLVMLVLVEVEVVPGVDDVMAVSSPTITTAVGCSGTL